MKLYSICNTAVEGVLRRTLMRRLAIGTIAVSAALCSVTPAVAQTYSWQSVKVGGGGYVPEVIAHPGQQGLFYARTDVGGAYRYNPSNGTWIPLLDSFSPSQALYDDIEAIAIDPNNPNMLYMVAGGGGDWSQTCCGGVLISNNQGASFTIVPLTFQVNGNERGRNVGARLQVDPNLGSTLFYGTANSSAGASTNGLWKSTDSGAHWSQVTSFPVLSSDDSGAGISFVAFYKPSGSSSQATSRIFVGVNTQPAANAGATLYQSTDGGNSWSQVVGAPIGQLPQVGRIGPDGNLYITYAQHDTTSTGWGPDGLINGQVWKYSVTGSNWTNITPPNDSPQLAGWLANYGFSGLSVDPAHPGVVAAMTVNRYDGHGEALFRTTNGGQSWVDATAKSSFDTSYAPWSGAGGRTGIGNWSGVALDPFDQNHAFATWGGGVLSTHNLTASASGQTVNFALDENGIEESVPLGLASPNTFPWGGSVPLVSAMGDMCGFFHSDVTQAPSTTICPGGNSTSIDWAKNVPSIVVRVGTGGGFPGGISYNGGYSWNTFMSTPAGVTQGGGSVAVNADGSAILWTPWDRNMGPFLSTNSSYSWTQLPLPAGAEVAADGYDGRNLFAYDRPSGKFYTSLDKGATWNQSSTPNAWHDIATPFGRGCDIWLYGYGGLYHNTNCGWRDWPQISGTSNVKALGFGKAAPGQWYPAIYMSGTYNGVAGLFRSVDGGTNWVRINDDQHQYGGFRLLTGDPKTFGTVYAAPNSGRGIITGTSPN